MQTRATKEWRSDDVELLQRAVALSAEIQATVFLVEQGRQRGISYPLGDPEELAGLIPATDPIVVAGHTVDRQSVLRHMAGEWFPIEDELDLMRRIHLGLLSCRETAEPESSRSLAANFTWRVLPEGDA